jgi:hypothetical protein
MVALMRLRWWEEHAAQDGGGGASQEIVLEGRALVRVCKVVHPRRYAPSIAETEARRQARTVVRPTVVFVVDGAT